MDRAGIRCGVRVPVVVEAMMREQCKKCGQHGKIFPQEYTSCPVFSGSKLSDLNNAFLSVGDICGHFKERVPMKKPRVIK
jgi:hypothetical protein